MKAIRRVQLCKADEDLLVLEGPHLISEAVRAGVDLETVLTTPAFAARAEGEALLFGLPAQVERLEVSESVLRAITDSDSPRGTLAVGRWREPGVERCIAEFVPGSVPSCVLYVDGVQDPGNLGALLRLAAAADCAAVFLASGSASWRHPRTLRASAGAAFRVPVVSAISSRSLANVLPPEFVWCGLHAHGGKNLYETSLIGPCVLAVGSEGGGLSSEVGALCAMGVTIPLLRQTESLNVTSATAVVLFERRRQLAESLRVR